MKNSDTFYRIRIVLLTWLKLPILIHLDPLHHFLDPLHHFLDPCFLLVLLVNITNIEVYSPIICGINIFSVNLHT